MIEFGSHRGSHRLLINPIATAQQTITDIISHISLLPHVLVIPWTGSRQGARQRHRSPTVPSPSEQQLRRCHEPCARGLGMDKSDHLMRIHLTGLDKQCPDIEWLCQFDIRTARQHHFPQFLVIYLGMHLRKSLLIRCMMIGFVQHARRRVHRLAVCGCDLLLIRMDEDERVLATRLEGCKHKALLSCKALYIVQRLRRSPHMMVVGSVWKPVINFVHIIFAEI